MDFDVLLCEFFKVIVDLVNWYLVVCQFFIELVFNVWDDVGSVLLIDYVVFVEI